MARTPRHVADLIADPQNRRTHPARNVAMIVDALRKVGAARSVVIDETNQLLAGNGVVQAAREAGLSKVQVVDVDGDTIVAVRRRDLTPAQKRELAIYDNRTGELAEWNLEQLTADLQNGEDLGAFFLDTELQELLKVDRLKRGRTDPDAVPEPRATDIQPGDRFALGAHALSCGDSARAADVAALMAGSRADALVTSPPYNVGVVYATHDDATVSAADYFAWLRGVLRAWRSVLRDGRAVVWNVGVSPKTAPHRHALLLEEAGLTFVRQFVWRKMGVPVPTFHMTRAHPRVRSLSANYTHEMVYVFATGGALAVGGPQSLENEVLEHDVFTVHQALATVDLPAGPERTGVRSGLDRRSFKAHPAAFPVALVTAFLQHYLGPDEIVVDPFGGSGTTIIAAEQLGTAARVMEIAPTYCQVAIDRWEAFTGQHAVKVGEAVRA